MLLTGLGPGSFWGKRPFQVGDQLLGVRGKVHIWKLAVVRERSTAPAALSFTNSLSNSCVSPDLSVASCLELLADGTPCDTCAFLAQAWKTLGDCRRLRGLHADLGVETKLENATVFLTCQVAGLRHASSRIAEIQRG